MSLLHSKAPSFRLSLVCNAPRWFYGLCGANRPNPSVTWATVWRP